MDNSSGLRLAVIAALLLGSIYILLPTYFGNDARSALSAQVQQVDTPTAAAAPDTRVVFEAASASEASAAVLQARLAAAGLSVNGVRLDEQGRLLVEMAAPTTREDVLKVAEPRGAMVFADLASAALFAEAPLDLDAALASPEVASLSGRALPATARPMSVQITGFEVSGDRRLSLAVDGLPAADVPALFAVEIDGAVRALAQPQTDSEADAGVKALLMVTLDDEPDLPVLLAAEPLPDVLRPIPVVEQVAAAWLQVSFPSGTEAALEQLRETLTALDLVVEKAAVQEDGKAVVEMGSASLAKLEDALETPEVKAAVRALDLEETEQLSDRELREVLYVFVEQQGKEAGLEVPEREKLPDWLAQILPNTKMSLGLDLFGGIDLTLQVGLEEAVLAQATRDLAYLKEQAARDGIIVDRARRERTQPSLRLTTDAALSDLQSWMARSMSDYQYSFSESEETGDAHIFAMKDDRVLEVQDQAVEQVLETLRKRVNETGVKEPVIVKKGGGRISVQLPGLEDLQQAVDTLGTTAVLEFYMVDEEFDELELDRMLEDAEEALTGQQFTHDETLNHYLHDAGRLADDRIVLWEYDELADGTRERVGAVPLYADAILTGNDVNNAQVSWDQNRIPYVALEFKPRGAKIFAQVTGDNVGKRFAIVLDKEVRSAPSIREKISGGRASIEMGASENSMRDSEMLSLVLRTGSLNAPVDIGEVRTVRSTLGDDAIEAGRFAVLIGGVLVLLFMGVNYRTAGVVADAALVLNVMMVLAALAVFGATLTLPGIAGIGLTVGMAVDANIIIYERIREELALGQSARKAVESGYEKAAVAVIDANVTTAIAGVVLYSYGSGPIKGFAVTLLIGIATTLITALFVTRTMMERLTRNSNARLRI